MTRPLAVPPSRHCPLSQPAGAAIVTLQAAPSTPRPRPTAALAETYEDARRLIKMGYCARARTMLADAGAAGGEGAALLLAWAKSPGLGGGA